MSFMFEVIYRAPMDEQKNKLINGIVAAYGGVLDCIEEPEPHGPSSVILTYEFNSYDQAFTAANKLRELGFKVDGPYDYGP